MINGNDGAMLLHDSLSPHTSERDNFTRINDSYLRICHLLDFVALLIQDIPRVDKSGEMAVYNWNQAWEFLEKSAGLLKLYWEMVQGGNVAVATIFLGGSTIVAAVLAGKAVGKSSKRGLKGVLIGQQKQDQYIRDRDFEQVLSLESALANELILVTRVAESRLLSIENKTTRSHFVLPEGIVFRENAGQLHRLRPDFSSELLTFHSYLHDVNLIMQTDNSERKVSALKQLATLGSRASTVLSDCSMYKKPS